MKKINAVLLFFLVSAFYLTRTPADEVQPGSVLDYNGEQGQSAGPEAQIQNRQVSGVSASNPDMAMPMSYTTYTAPPMMMMSTPFYDSFAPSYRNCTFSVDGQAPKACSSGAGFSISPGKTTDMNVTIDMDIVDDLDPWDNPTYSSGLTKYYFTLQAYNTSTLPDLTSPVYIPLGPSHVNGIHVSATVNVPKMMMMNVLHLHAWDVSNHDSNVLIGNIMNMP